MANPLTGLTSNSSEPKALHITANTVGPFRHGLDTIPHQFVRFIASDAAEAGSEKTVIVATAHLAAKGDVIRWTSGLYTGFELSVVSTTANAITLGQSVPVVIAPGDTFNILRYTSPLVAANGGIVTGSSPAATLVPLAPNSGLVGVASGLLVAANPLRTKITLQLLTATAGITVSLGYGFPAVLNAGECLLGRGGILEMVGIENYTGAINAIASAAATIVSFQEWQ